MSSLHPDDPDATGLALPALGRPAEDLPPAAEPDRLSPLLTGSVGRALLGLAVPVLAEQILNTLVGITDIFLARFVGPRATVAVGMAAQFGWLIGILFGLVGTAATALVARSFGQRAYAQAGHVANQAIGIALGMGVVFSLGVLAVAPRIPPLFGLESDAVPLAVRYVRIDAVGHLLSGVLFVGSACLRGAGDTRSPLGVMIIVNACNIAVSAVLTLGLGGVPTLGVAGIAAGTAVARLMGGGLILLTLARGRASGPAASIDSAARLRLDRRHLRPRPETFRRLMRIGLPAGLDGLAIWLGQLLFVKIINALAKGDLQTDIYAAHIIGIRIESLSYLPSFAWATAAATMVGQSLGAGRPDRAYRSGQLAARQAATLTFLLGLTYTLLAPQWYRLFTDSARVIAIGTPALRLLGLFQIPCALMIVYVGALRGAGDTRFPLLFSLVGMVVVRLPLAYLGGHVLGWGLPGAWIGMFADMTARAGLGMWRFMQGGWKRVRV